MKGLELSKKYYECCGLPMLEEQFPELLPHLAIGLCGSGSECFGFDDGLSQDHDFEPGFCIFLPGEDVISRRDAFLLERAYAKLPKEFEGFRRCMLAPAGGARHGVLSAAEFFLSKIGSEDGNLSPEAWLSLPEYSLAEAVNGEIFRDDDRFFTKIREKIAHYPRDIRLKKLAGNLLLLSQSGSYNYDRCLKHGETAAAQMSLYEFIKAAMQTAFLLSERYMPYYKWSFRALSQLESFPSLPEYLEFLISTGNDDDTAENKHWVMDEVISRLLEVLQEQELTDAICQDCQKHAESVNDRISDPTLRNLSLLAGV